MLREIRKTIKPIMALIVIIFVVSCFFMYGSGPSQTESEEGAPVAGVDAGVAVVDGEVVTRARLDSETERYMRAMGVDPSVVSEDDYPAIRNAVINNMAVAKELEKEIAARGIKAPEGAVDSAMRNIIAKFPTKEIYLQQLRNSGMTEEELRKNVEDDIKGNALLEQATGTISADEAELRDAYSSMKEYLYRKPEGFMADVAHFRTKAAADAARAALERGDGWDDAVASVSNDVTSHSTSDDKMFVPADAFQGELASLKDLKLGEPSRVIAFPVSGDNAPSAGGFMLMVKRSSEAAGISPFEEVSADVKRFVLNQKSSSSRNQFLMELRARADVKLTAPELFGVSPDNAASSSQDRTPASPDKTPAASQDKAPVPAAAPVSSPDAR